MRRFHRANVILGIAVCAAALLTAFLWVPMDSATGLIEKVRRQVVIGDALAPTVAAAFLFVGGAMVTLLEPAGNAHNLTARNLGFLAVLLLLLAAAFTLMRWFGPATAALLTETGYRPLRDTAPWKYLGFIAGGTVLVAGLIALVERRPTLRGCLIGLIATLALIVLYDLPFDDLLLPPNGDV